MAVCAECTYLNLNEERDYGKYLCEKKYEPHLATDPSCGSYCPDYNRDRYTINNAIDNSKSHTSGGCYLTTILCNILGLPDNNEYLETMRSFRDNVLQKDEKYKSLLVEYDIIGPKIAEAIKNDPLQQKVAKLFFERDIVPITNLIKSNKDEEAINAYYLMTSTLSNFYGINKFNISIKQIDNYDIKQAGHGRYIQNKITLN